MKILALCAAVCLCSCQSLIDKIRFIDSASKDPTYNIYLAVLPDGRDASGYNPGPNYLYEYNLAPRYDGRLTRQSINSARDLPRVSAWHKPGYIRSPYAPHQVLDVRGIANGSYLKDPQSGQVFILDVR